MYYEKIRVILSAVLVAMASAAMAQQNTCAPFSIAAFDLTASSTGELCETAKERYRQSMQDPAHWPYRINVCSVQEGYSISQVGANGVVGITWSGPIVGSPCQKVCDVGTPNKVNVTVGYSRTQGGADGKMAVVVSRPWEGGSVCFEGCRYDYGDPIAAWWHDVPTSSGLYRASMDMNVQGSGATCTDDSPAVSQVQENGPDCPGSVGQVNGKPYCAGTAQNPVANDEEVKSPLPNNTGNPATGNIGAGGTGPDRTPATGTGGPRGGPGGTGSVLTPGGGGSGSGVVTKPADGTEQANCGAPGQPKCAIDETGTSRDGSHLLNGANGQIDESREGLLDLVNEAKELKSPEWTWTFQLPSGCTNMSFTYFGETIEVDVCRWQSTIHDLMSMLWIATTIAGCIILVNRTMSQ